MISHQSFPPSPRCNILDERMERTQTTYENRIYTVHIKVPEDYPASPPEVQFHTQINMCCVDSRTGKIRKAAVPAIKNWNRNMGIESILIGLRAEMAGKSNRKLRQPEENAHY